MHEVQHVDAVGTSAARDAEGAEEFLRAAESILGVRPHIINGQREAALTFEGALCGLDAAGAVVACDIGGGSTEIVLGERDSAGASRLQHAVSVDVGSVRLTERYLTDDPATAAQIGAARQDVRNELRRIERPPAGATFVGLAGTVTTLAAVQLGLERYDPARVHGAKLASVDIVGMRQMLSGLSVGARRGTPGLEPGRADVIVAGAVILEEVLRWAGAEQMLVSDRGVRWGLALERCRTL
jgi:exopolyphosphatase/guanosine-5'-triphosphate,3'-diphosphate pyrophosphatase